MSSDLVRRLAITGVGIDDAVREARAGLLSDGRLAFQQAIDHPDDAVGTPTFVVSKTPFLDDTARVSARMVGKRIGAVLLAHRLREVRVLHGFRRYDYDSDLVDVNLGPRGRNVGCRQLSRLAKASS